MLIHYIGYYTDTIYHTDFKTCKINIIKILLYDNQDKITQDKITEDKITKDGPIWYSLTFFYKNEFKFRMPH